MKVKILAEKELRQAVGINLEAIAAIEAGFSALAEDRAAMPPIMHIEVPEHQGDVDIKAAYVQGLDHMAVKVGAGFFNNHKIGLPNSPAMMVAVSTRTGFVEGVLLDNAYLTDVRTGAAGAVAARYLAPQAIQTAGVVGTGAQGRYQIQGLMCVRKFDRLLAFDLDKERLAKYVREMEKALRLPVIAADSVEQLVKQSQTVVTCTPSRKPYLEAAWIHPGLHLTCMGADLPEKRELMPEVLGRINLLSCDRKSQCFKMGELHHGLEAGVISEATDIAELGDMTSGKRSGRRDDTQITLCDLTGTGVQDTAIANLALKKSQELGLGTEIDIKQLT
ncbi:MAG: cyclodeaminase [Deltaproteobacteria bacterium]|nr:cyclodeaminase [Deltaproteobacteria bacterium]